MYRSCCRMGAGWSKRSMGWICTTQTLNKSIMTRDDAGPRLSTSWSRPLCGGLPSSTLNYRCQRLNKPRNDGKNLHLNLIGSLACIIRYSQKVQSFSRVRRLCRVSRTEPGLDRRCPKSHGSGWVGSGQEVCKSLGPRRPRPEKISDIVGIATFGLTAMCGASLVSKRENGNITTTYIIS